MANAENQKLLTSDGGSMPVFYSDGHCLPPFPQIVETVNNFRSFACRDDDVWILAHPGSGTHWFWEITSMLVNGKAERIDAVKEDTMIEAMANFPPDNLEKKNSPRVLNTHLAPRYFPEGALQRGKMIYVVRNPKDACVSIYNHIKGVKEFYDGSFTGYYELFRDGKTYYGDWFSGLSQWWEISKKQSNLLFLTYEEAKQDLASSVKKVAEFIQKPASDELIGNIADLCTFKKMKQEKKEFMKDTFKENASYYRKGIAGDWKNWFTVAQNDEYDKLFAERTKSWDSHLKALVIFQ